MAGRCRTDRAAESAGDGRTEKEMRMPEDHLAPVAGGATSLLSTAGRCWSALPAPLPPPL
jgi:hypothetical protein